MKIRIVQARIVDERHPDNGKTRDILIEKGRITKIAARIDDIADKEIHAKDLCVSIGWMDMRVNFRDPGQELREDIHSGLAAAENGGFTAVAVMPSTEPPIDSKGGVAYLLDRARSAKTEVIPVGTISKNQKGESLSEMYDMYLAGAKAFGDDKKSLAESGLLQRALLYAQTFDAPVFHFPYDATLVPHGQIHEGVQSTVLGLRGIPAIAEEMMVARDITLADYTEGRLHLGPLSSTRSVMQITAARKKGVKLTCETTAAHLAFSDESLAQFDTAFKLMPPLRTEKNRRELIKALSKGLIDVITSDHCPEDEEHKKREFEYAAFGMAGIEAFFPMVYTHVGDRMALDKLVATFSLNPRRILGMALPEIKPGEKANLTLFSTGENTVFDTGFFKTKAYNKPLTGQTLRGKVIGIMC